MKEYKSAVFIGRFQPFHTQHLQVLQHALEIAEQVIVIIGSYRSAPDVKNPFSYQERVSMIKAALWDHEITHGADGSTHTIIKDQLHCIKFIPVRDYYYNDNLWCAEIQQKTSEFIRPGDSVALVGAYKDSSSYYLNLFPQWDFIPLNQPNYMNATDIRSAMFNREESLHEYNPYHPDKAVLSLKDEARKLIKEYLPEKVKDWLDKNFYLTPKYHNLVNEFNQLKEYKKLWADSPFPPTFVTVDAVVICSGHVLVVKRKFNPGMGLYALPGGFIKQSEKLEDAAIRELKEETGIDIPKPVLRNNIVESKVFDYPGRSLRGRTITHVYAIKLRDGELPKVRGNDDAEVAIWMPIYQLYENQDKFFEDHFFIIEHFLQRS